MCSMNSWRIASLAGSRRRLYKELLVELIKKGEINLAVEQIAEELGLSVVGGGNSDAPSE